VQRIVAAYGEYGERTGARRADPTPDGTD
jgi:hypothetical protein